MPVTHKDILRVVQIYTLPDGGRMSNKFYLVADLTDPVLDAAATSAIETWVAFVYHAVRNVVSQNAQLREGQIDIITWETGAWRTVWNVGVIYPDPEWNNDQPLCPDPVAGLLTFTTAWPRYRRPFYLGALTEDRVSGSHCTGYVVTRMVELAVRALDPVDLMPSGLLYPVLVHALVGSAENLTGAMVTNLLSALHRRRPTP